MVVFAIVGGIGQQTPNLRAGCGAADAAGELWRIVRGPAVHLSGKDELAAGVANRRQFDEMTPFRLATSTHAEVMTLVLGIQSGGINGGRGRAAKEFLLLSSMHQGI